MSQLKHRSLRFEDIHLGMSESFSKQVTIQDVEVFAEVTGDKNPIHLDAEYAKNSLFGQQIAHGMYLGGLVSALIGMRMPGLGTIYLSQSFKFMKPVFLNDEVKTTAIVTALFKEKQRLSIACLCTVNGETVLEGEALVKKP